jgi:hypothetical protein
VQVLPALAGVLDQDLFRPGAARAYALSCSGPAGGSQFVKGPDGVDRSTSEVPRARAATSEAIA